MRECDTHYASHWLMPTFNETVNSGKLTENTLSFVYNVSRHSFIYTSVTKPLLLGRILSIHLDLRSRSPPQPRHPPRSRIHNTSKMRKPIRNPLIHHPLPQSLLLDRALVVIHHNSLIIARGFRAAVVTPLVADDIHAVVGISEPEFRVGSYWFGA